MGETLRRYHKLFESLKKSPARPLYFLYGPEEYLKQEFIGRLLDSVLSDADRTFNLDIIFGDEFDRIMFDDRMGSFPLFRESRVVVLRKFESVATAEKDHVIAVASNLPESVVLVVETTTEKLDTTRMKNMKKVADMRGSSFNFEYLDRVETSQRVQARFRREGYEIDRDALELLVESVGARLIDLVNEVEKICLSAVDENVIGRELVESVVGKYKTEDLFSLLHALEDRSPDNMLRKLNRLLDWGEEPVVMLGMLLKRVALLIEVKALMDEHGRAAGADRALAGLMAGQVSPFYAGKLRKQALRLERADMDTLLANLRWAEFKLKTSRLEARYVVEEALLATHIGKTLARADVSM